VVATVVEDGLQRVQVQKVSMVALVLNHILLLVVVVRQKLVV
jgi:hypothetical protein